MCASMTQPADQLAKLIYAGMPTLPGTEICDQPVPVFKLSALARGHVLFCLSRFVHQACQMVL